MVTEVTVTEATVTEVTATEGKVMEATGVGIIVTVVILTGVTAITNPEEDTGIVATTVTTGVTHHVFSGKTGIAVMGTDVHFHTMGRTISKLAFDPKRNNTRRAKNPPKSHLLRASSPFARSGRRSPNEDVSYSFSTADGLLYGRNQH